MGLAFDHEPFMHCLFAKVFLTNNHLAIAMEYASGGNLYQLVARSGGLPEKDARWYFQQLVLAIDYCHKMVRSMPRKGTIIAAMHRTVGQFAMVRRPLERTIDMRFFVFH